ncbi:response regulator transcription factor [Methylotenera mobilis]|jgi:two-component system, response regulator RegA|uniref:DNA-binding response regulator n=2 Tax=Methylotenera TaxID=359407 RepID=A0A351RCD3_9PROT|nr:response regulator transcription factor [Methylotenera mobilis]PPC96592.1 MAG: DNA-binding response regulator [Methylotenera sp.]HBA09704.1 DNA-binding response regulator [Methylotenera mobilis]
MSDLNTDTRNSDEHPTLLLVDDDDAFLNALAMAMRKRGFLVTLANSAETAFELAQADPPEFAVVDLKMSGNSGLVLVRQLASLQAATKIVILTGYASIATAIEAIKLGATHYLAKPVDADEIVAAFSKQSGNEEIELSHNPLSVDRLEWEHIQRVLVENDGNISATARSLNMHRRTLQRKLGKKPSINPTII